MENSSHIRDLLLKHWKGELSPSESTELSAWAGLSFENRELLESLSDADKTLTEIAELERAKEPAWRNIRFEDQKQNKVPVVKWWRIAAAAAVIATLIGGFYWYQSSINTPSLTVTETNRSTLPNRSTLTKSDGSIIRLDSLKAGTVMLEDGAKIVKKDNGELVYYPGTDQSAAVVYNTITTTPGSTQEIRLSDQTTVWLNASSSLRFPTAFSGATREVELTGEGFFEVSKNKEKPFLVKVDSLTLRVLGTSFDINSYPDEHLIRSTLFEGSVRVSKKEVAFTLVPGQQVQLDRKTNDIRVVADADLDAVSAWRYGNFSLDEADIASLMRQVARWYDVQAIYPYGVPDIKLSGEISRDMPLDELLKGLTQSGVKTRLEGKKIIVLK